MLKRLVIAALLLGVSLASAKSYTISLSDACKAGQAQLQPGQYTLKLDGNKVVLIDRTGRSIEVTAKVETADRKYGQTAVAVSRADGASRIQWIALGGSKSKVVFE
jgi:hypothetical protein